MKKKKRTIYNVHWRTKVRYPAMAKWMVTRRGGDFEAAASTKLVAVRFAVGQARANQPSQVVVHTKDGRIQSERTYGQDPRRSKG